jgi:outer membrane protein OmpA-like peptidoglycan-associated protein
MNRIATMMEKKPRVRLRICGKATPGDREALSLPQTELLQLAEQRARAMKNYLMSEHGVDGDRLMFCRPVYEADPQAAPRADIYI